jgi:hypothetical protein
MHPINIVQEVCSPLQILPSYLEARLPNQSTKEADNSGFEEE